MTDTAPATDGEPRPDTGLADPVSGEQYDEPSDVGTETGLIIETSEGAQELFPRTRTEPGELRREVGAVLRLPEGVVLNADDIDVEQTDDETMIINMGPQHPSTHGVLRLMIELDGETVLRTKPVIGYLHTGMEKTAEELTYVQGSTNVTRMDYLSPLHNELVLSLAPLGLDPDAPGRAQPGLVPSHVDGHQRHGPCVDVDDDLRLPRARDDPGLLREDDRPAHEPQLHPSRGHRRRPARRLGGRRHRHL
jgi:hypothetical protein